MNCTSIKQVTLFRSIIFTILISLNSLNAQSYKFNNKDSSVDYSMNSFLSINGHVSEFKGTVDVINNTIVSIDGTFPVSSLRLNNDYGNIVKTTVGKIGKNRTVRIRSISIKKNTMVALVQMGSKKRKVKFTFTTRLNENNKISSIRVILRNYKINEIFKNININGTLKI